MKNEKKSQVTIFIILGLMIIVLILIFLVLKKPPQTGPRDEENPESFIDTCTREALDEAIQILNQQGGDIEPKGSIKYNDINRTYLCYNQNYYQPCVNQRPMLINHVKEEIYSYVFPRIESCFSILEENLAKTHEVNSGHLEIEINLLPSSAEIAIYKNLELKKEDISKTYDNFKIKTFTPIYELLEIANEIAGQEAEFCYFNVNGFNSNYPRFNVKKEMIQDSKIYIIKDKDSTDTFTFAIRSCVMPPGL